MEIVAHPLLGDAHVIERDGCTLTAMSALDWQRPTRIPTVAEPARLPPGAGSALLNEIARRAEFTRDVLGRAMRLASDEIAIDFEPAPHERRDVAHGWVEVREHLVERAVIDGSSFERDGSPARLLGDWAAEIWFGDAPYARVAD